MERLRKSFRRKKQKEIADDEAEEETERDELETKSVLTEEPGDTEEETDQVKNGLSKSVPSRLQKLRKSIRFSRKKKGSDEVEGQNDFLPPDEPEIVPDDESLKPGTRMSRLRASLRRKKKKEKEKPDKEVVEKEKKEKKSSKWETDDKKVRENHCEFKVKYLGSVEVQESRGMEVCESAIKTLKARSTNEKKKKLRAVLHVSGDGLRVVDKKTQGMLVDQVIMISMIIITLIIITMVVHYHEYHHQIIINAMIATTMISIIITITIITITMIIDAMIIIIPRSPLSPLSQTSKSLWAF